MLSLVSRHAKGEVTSEEQMILAPTAAPKVAASDSETPSEDEAEPEVVTSSKEPSGNFEAAPHEPEQVAEDTSPASPAITEEGGSVPEPQEPTVVAALEPIQPVSEAPSEDAPASAAIASPANPVAVPAC